MVSAVGGNLDLIESGPCKLTYKGVALGHTMGGCTFAAKPDLRVRNVDEYGTHVADMIYQGEDLTVKTTLAEKSMQSLQVAFQYGYAYSASVRSFGRLPGYKASAISGLLLIHPLSAGVSTAHDLTLYNAALSEADEIQFGVITADRVFGVTFRAMVDESMSDGNLLGCIGAPI